MQLVPCFDRRSDRSAAGGYLEVRPFDFPRDGPAATIRLLTPGPNIVGHRDHARFNPNGINQILREGFDVGRLHWSATVPFPLQILGLIGFAMGMGLTTWAMLVNRFFSSAVRLQPDRGQQVVSSGPYRLVRHPGYSGGLLLLLSIGLALGSWIAIVPMLLIVPFMVRGTLIEERMLSSALPG